MKREFVQKLLEAKRLELEALTLLLPEGAGRHMLVIGREMGDMLCDWLSCETAKQERVHKVTIE